MSVAATCACCDVAKCDACCCSMCVWCGVAEIWCLLLQCVCVVLLKCDACFCSMCVGVALLKCEACCCNCVCVVLLKCDACCCNVCMVSLKREACCCNVGMCVWCCSTTSTKWASWSRKRRSCAARPAPRRPRQSSWRKVHTCHCQTVPLSHISYHAPLVLQSSWRRVPTCYIWHVTAPLSPYIVHTRTAQSSWSKVPTCCCLTVPLSPYSPWYNCTSWLGLKHQLTYCYLISYHVHMQHACSEQLKRGTQLSLTVPLSPYIVHARMHHSYMCVTCILRAAEEKYLPVTVRLLLSPYLLSCTHRTTREQLEKKNPPHLSLSLPLSPYLLLCTHAPLIHACTHPTCHCLTAPLSPYLLSCTLFLTPSLSVSFWMGPSVLCCTFVCVTVCLIVAELATV